MRKILKNLSLLAIFALAFAPFAGHCEEMSSPVKVVQDFYETLLSVMKDADKLGFQGRYAKLQPAIERAYNLPLMTRLTIGPQWQSLSPDDQEKLTDAFSAYTVATYANRFDGYSGEKLEVTPKSSSAEAGTIVETKLIKSSGEPVALNYLMRETNGKPQIIDVYLSGTISELATRRAEFNSVIRRDGAAGLLQLLKRRVAELKTAS
jgi:phospholipid transport system substrate-binding protein